MIGEILVRIAFAACLISVVSYVIHHFRGIPRLRTIGRWGFVLSAVGVFGTAAVLLTLILTHQFQYTYVWSYSSRALSTPLLISTFYAGQEGSFMLWTLFTAIIGLFLLRYAMKMGYESQVMGVFGLVELMLLLMLIVKNPFLTVWQSWPGEVEAGFVPADGRGLNPLLQNYWMVIHPQVLFSGFAAMAVPYAFAVAALLKRDYTQWIKPATPWMVFAGLILGTGIMMGGFWAYETLGWGGYWGWDPVENSSLVPWIVCIAGMHTILSQRKSGGFVRTNLILAMLAFMMVLYSTFLTRSGVLGDTSVHSFVDPGMWVYWLLIGVIVVFLAIGIVLLAVRWREIPKPKATQSLYSREFALFLGSMTLVAAALLITGGTSAPIITEVLEGKKSAIDISYYVKTMLPVGVLIGVLTGIGQLLWWTRSRHEEMLRVLRWPVLLSVLVTIALVPFGLRGVGGIAFVLAAAFAFFSNLQVGIRVFKGNPKFMGGAVAHIGLALMFFGFIASSEYDTEQTLSLSQGTPHQALGYTLTYVGYHATEDEKYAFHVDVERDGKRFQVSPVMYHSTYNDGLMRNPDILNLITSDFYLAPVSLEQPGEEKKRANADTATFRIGQTKTMGDLTVTFLGFTLPEGHAGRLTEMFRIGARFSVARNGSSATLVEPAKVIKGNQSSDVAALHEGRFEFVISGLTPNVEQRDKATVDLRVTDLQKAGPASPDILVVEASIKPYINFVWAGLIVLLVGFLVTIVRRSQEASLKSPPAPEVA